MTPQPSVGGVNGVDEPVCDTGSTFFSDGANAAAMSDTPRLAVPYLRVSTDDKGQRPERQLDLIQAWAQTHGVALLQPIIDEGTSASKTQPFERTAFMRAVEEARKARAQAIVVETGDRFSRQGIKPAMWAMHEMWGRWALELWFSDLDYDLQRGFAGEIVIAVNFGTAREFSKALSARTISGMARAKANGARFGRPVKRLAQREVDLMLKLDSEGISTHKIALRLSEERGAFDTTNPKLRRDRTVSPSLVQRELRASKLACVKSPEPSEEAAVANGGTVSTQGEGA